MGRSLGAATRRQRSSLTTDTPVGYGPGAETHGRGLMSDEGKGPGGGSRGAGSCATRGWAAAAFGAGATAGRAGDRRFAGQARGGARRRHGRADRRARARRARLQGARLRAGRPRRQGALDRRARTAARAVAARCPASTASASSRASTTTSPTRCGASPTARTPTGSTTTWSTHRAGARCAPNGRADAQLFGIDPGPGRGARRRRACRRSLIEEIVKHADGPAARGRLLRQRLAVFLTSCDERRFGQWEYVPWWDFVGAASRSAEYQKVVARGPHPVARGGEGDGRLDADDRQHGRGVHHEHHAAAATTAPSTACSTRPPTRPGSSPGCAC